MLAIILCFLSLAVAAAEHHTPKDFFGGSDHDEYLTWADEASYENFFFLPHRSDESLGLSLHWTLDKSNEMLKLGVAVRATGWMGFGISENGGMGGSDMFIFEAAKNETIIDAYTMRELVKPTEDDCNDWELVASRSEGEFLVVEVQRALDTGDLQDRVLIPDGLIDLPPTFVISAWGDEEEHSYHGPKNFARGRVRFYGDGTAGDEEFRQMMETESKETMDLFARNHVLDASMNTEYVDICFTWDDILAMGVPADEPFSIVGIEPVIEQTEFVHHFTLFASDNPMTGRSCEDFADHLDLVYGWGPGETSQALPKDVGLTVGGDSYRSFRLEIHYNNPKLEANVTDSSGVRFYYTDELRPIEMGLLQIGDPTTYLNGQEIGDGITEHWFDCPSTCSDILLENVTVLREYMHMHSLGRTAKFEQFRNGKKIHTGGVEFFDFWTQGNQLVLQGPHDIQRGDSFRTSCVYDTTNEPGAKFGKAFLMYYPKQRLLDLFPWFCDPDPDLGVSACVSTFENRTLDEVPRGFGSKMDQGQCSGGTGLWSAVSWWVVHMSMFSALLLL